MKRNPYLKQMFYSLPQDLRRGLWKTLNKREFDELQNLRTVETTDGYSLLPFDRYKCIFVHIPKTAGVSICRTLFGNLGGAHSTVSKYQTIFSKREFEEYFKFTFVRNPWDRTFSAYRFLAKGGMNEGDKNWAQANISQYETFEEFVKRWLNRTNIWAYPHFLPQYHYLCLPTSREILVDFLGFFENIEDDFRYIVKRLGLESEIALKHENATSKKKPDYRDFYSDETRDIVAAVYAEDIHLLGYDFDNTSLDQLLKRRLKS
jgi:hypothetical protein